MCDRERLIELICACGDDALNKHIPLTADKMADYLIANGVTVQKHGRWISEKCNHKPYRIKNPEKWVIYKCSACGYSNGRKQTNFCPNCGVYMKGDADAEKEN